VISYRTTYDALVGEKGRNPMPEEVCAVMGLTSRQATELMSELNSSQCCTSRTSTSQAHNDGAFVDILSDESAEPEAEVLASAEAEALEEAMATLAAREHTVLYLSFFAGLTQEQIGQIIGVGGPQVCKIHGAALRKLRSILGRAEPRWKTHSPAERKLQVDIQTLIQGGRGTCATMPSSRPTGSGTRYRPLCLAKDPATK